MADREPTAASSRESKEDPSKVADEVVNNLKSQGLFDQFRKECLEELEHLVRRKVGELFYISLK